MKISIEKLARKGVLKLQPYTCARDLYKTADVFLDANESPYGGSFGQLNRYPDSDQLRLRKELAGYVGGGVGSKNILAGNGSDEMIDLCMRVFTEKGDNILCASPDYSMYKVSAAINGIKATEVPLSSFRFSADSFIRKANRKTKMVFFSSPNSPLGIQPPLAEIRKLAKNLNAIIFVDEAYFEFSGKSAASLLKDCPNIIVSRTLSKAWGLAGARVGYIIASKEIISLVRKIKPSYNISSLSERAAIAALRKKKLMQSNVRRMGIERTRLANSLLELGFATYPSVANFILCGPPQPITASDLQAKLAKKGIIVRDFSSKALLDGCLRISVGSQRENRLLLSELSSLLKPKYDAVIFDMDEVLVDTAQSYLKAIAITARKLSGGKPINKNDVSNIKRSKWFNDDIDAAYRLAGLAGKGKLAIAQTAAKITGDERRSGRYSRAIRIFQSAYLGKKYSGLILREKPLIKSETLQILCSAGIRLGIATGRPRTEAQFAIRKNGWQKFFSAVVCYEDTGRKKPYPDPILLAKKSLGAKNPLYVGDAPADAEAARRAGVDFAMVGKRGIPGSSRIARTDYVLKLVVK